MQDDCLDVTNKPFYKRQKPPSRGASFRTSKIMLMLTWRLYYGGAVITSITVCMYMYMRIHVHVCTLSMYACKCVYIKNKKKL